MLRKLTTEENAGYCEVADCYQAGLLFVSSV